jgi:hypothetical protein
MPPTVQETTISDEELRNFDLKALVIKGGDYTIFPDVQVRKGLEMPLSAFENHYLRSETQSFAFLPFFLSSTHLWNHSNIRILANMQTQPWPPYSTALPRLKKSLQS